MNAQLIEPVNLMPGSVMVKWTVQIILMKQAVVDKLQLIHIRTTRYHHKEISSVKLASSTVEITSVLKLYTIVMVCLMIVKEMWIHLDVVSCPLLIITLHFDSSLTVHINMLSFRDPM